MEVLYPIFLALQSQPVLIVGGGTVGLRKAEGLLAANAHVTVLSVAFHSGFDQLPAIYRIPAVYEAGFLSRPEHPRWRLIFAATSSEDVNTIVYDEAARQGILCCRCDDPTAGDFIGPAVQRRGPITVAVTSSGAAPGLSGDLARQMVAAIDSVWVTQAELSRRWRSEVLEKLPAGEHRRILLQRLSGPEIRDKIQHGGAAAESLFESWLVQAIEETARRPGTVMDSRK